MSRVDRSRIKEVGPDRAAAEWLLRCGASVKFRDFDRWTVDYNLLPTGGRDRLKIVEVDATDSSIMHIGFEHFRKSSTTKLDIVMNISVIPNLHL